jgi:hypothetical protein
LLILKFFTFFFQFIFTSTEIFQPIINIGKMNKFLKLVLFVLLFYISKSVKLEIKVITYHDPPNIVISKGIYSGFLVDIFKSTVTQMNSNPNNNITYKFYETNGFFLII